jgi:hypothetical protein
LHVGRALVYLTAALGVGVFRSGWVLSVAIDSPWHQFDDTFRPLGAGGGTVAENPNLLASKDVANWTKVYGTLSAIY